VAKTISASTWEIAFSTTNPFSTGAHSSALSGLASKSVIIDPQDQMILMSSADWSLV
jgi:hypothetical protein